MEFSENNKSKNEIKVEVEEIEAVDSEIQLNLEFKHRLMIHQLLRIANTKLNDKNYQKIKRKVASKVEVYACFIRVGEIGSKKKDNF